MHKVHTIHNISANIHVYINISTYKDGTCTMYTIGCIITTSPVAVAGHSAPGRGRRGCLSVAAVASPLPAVAPYARCPG